MRKVCALVLLLIVSLGCTIAQAKDEGLAPAGSGVNFEVATMGGTEAAFERFIPMEPAVHSLSEFSSNEEGPQCVMESGKHAQPLSAVFLKTTRTSVLEHVKACGTHSVQVSEKPAFSASLSSGGVKSAAVPSISRQTVLHQNLVERK